MNRTKAIIISITISFLFTTIIFGNSKNPKNFSFLIKNFLKKESLNQLINNFFPKKISKNSSLKNMIPTPITNSKKIPFTKLTPTINLSKKSPTPISYNPSPTLLIPPSINRSTPTLIPLISKTPTSSTSYITCKKNSNNFYESIDVLRTNPKPVSQRDDLILPPMVLVQAKMDVFYEKVFDPDPKIPVFNEIFSPPRRPRFIAGYQSTREVRGSYVAEVEILEIETIPGEVLLFPYTDYDIGNGYRAMVLYVSENEITFKITREDDVITGYTIYIENICPDYNLKTLYDKLNQEGRRSLPVIKEKQPFGAAKKNTMKIAIRDTGTFLDLRQIDPETNLGFWR